MGLRPCIVCATPTQGARCELHAQWRTQDARRPSAHKRGYDRQWQRLVARVLVRDQHACQLRVPGVCVGKATTGDHTVPLSRGGARLDEDNVRAACRPCNSSKGNR